MVQFTHKLLTKIQNDDLGEALEFMLELCERDEKHSSLKMEVSSILGRFKGLKRDFGKDTISYEAYNRQKNQIRENILGIVNHLKTESQDQTEVRKMSKKSNRILDIVYKILLCLILMVGILILLYSIFSEQEFEEQIYLGSISMTGIFSSLYFYTRNRELEILKNKTK